MPTFIIKSIPNWKDAPQRVNNFGLHLHDANGEGRVVEFTRGWLQRFRPMTEGYITFRGSNTPWWVPSMAVYSPTGPDVLSVWPVDEKVSDPAPAAEAQDSPNHAEISEGQALLDEILSTPLSDYEKSQLDASGIVLHTESVEPKADEAQVLAAIKGANRPLSRVPSVLANPISKEIDVLARAGELGAVTVRPKLSEMGDKPGLLEAPLSTDERELVRALRKECAALKTNLDNCAKARDLAEINLTGARGQYQSEQAKVTTLTERLSGATERANRTEQRHGALVEKHAALEAEFDTQRETIRKLQNDGREQYDRLTAQAATIEQLRDEIETANMRADEKGLELEDLRANGAAYAAMEEGADPSINEIAREAAIERLTMSTALGLTREQLETIEAGMLEQLTTWEANEERRKLTEYGQTFKFFGGAQHAEAATEQGGITVAGYPCPNPAALDMNKIEARFGADARAQAEQDINTLLDNSPDRIKAREQAHRDILAGITPEKLAPLPIGKAMEAAWPHPATARRFGELLTRELMKPSPLAEMLANLPKPTPEEEAENRARGLEHAREQVAKRTKKLKKAKRWLKKMEAGK